jgi:O-antigen/teichoic acid export membrane protein
MTTRLRTTSALAIGSALSGVLAYVFFAVATRALGAVATAPVSVLWVCWSFTSAALTFPVQHWIARTVTVHEGERAVRDAMPHLARVTAAVSLAVVVATWLVRDRLFHSGDVLFPLMAGGVTLGAALMGVVRGVLSARRRFADVGATLVVENAIRCVAAVGLLLADVRAPEAYGAALLVGYVAAAAWTSTFRLGHTGSPATSSAVGFLGGAGIGQLAGQAVLTGGPVVLALAGGSGHEVTALFAGLALFRAPYTLALGLVSPLTERLSRMVVEERPARLRRFLLWVTGLTVVGCGGAALVGYVVGPPLLKLVFGDDVVLSSGLALVIAVGSTVAMGNLVASLVVMAHGRTFGLVRSWLVAVVPAALWFALSGAPLLDRTCWAFLIAEAGTFLLLLREGRPASGA